MITVKVCQVYHLQVILKINKTIIMNIRLIIFLILILSSCKSKRGSGIYEIAQEECEYTKIDELRSEEIISAKEFNLLEKLFYERDLKLNSYEQIWYSSTVEGYPKEHDTIYVIFFNEIDFFFSKIDSDKNIVSFKSVDNKYSGNIQNLVKKIDSKYYERFCDIEGGGLDIFFIRKNEELKYFLKSYRVGCDGVDSFIPVVNDCSEIVRQILKL
jgi:hypothetical protein